MYGWGHKAYHTKSVTAEVPIPEFGSLHTKKSSFTPKTTLPPKGLDNTDIVVTDTCSVDDASALP